MKLNKNIKKDISLALDIWSMLLTELLHDDIDYIFTKGSSLKEWETDIDYVPRISDVDLHIKFAHSRKKLFSNKNSLDQAMFLARSYEKNFTLKCQEENYNPTHLPRVQIVQLDSHGRKGYVVPPREKDVMWIKGKTDFPEEMDHNLVRKMDKKSILNEKSFIESIPHTLFELSQLDYYTLLYKLNSRISPTPIRLLTQVVNDNPHDIWALNKTSIKKELLNCGYNEIAFHYEQYYLQGWRLFESNFELTELYLEMIQHGYLVLKKCFDEIMSQH